MKILAIHNGGTLAEDIQVLTGNADVSVIDVTSPVMAVELLSTRKDIDLVVISMASVWGGSEKWLAVVRACGKTLPCVFIPDTCEIAAISGVILNNHVVCPINTPAGKKVFSTYVEGVLAATKSRENQVRQAPLMVRDEPRATVTQFDAYRPKVTGKCPRLTDRQKQILDLIVTGKSNREIAAELKLAEGTVKVHSISIYRLLGVSNRVQAVLRAQQLVACS